MTTINVLYSSFLLADATSSKDFLVPKEMTFRHPCVKYVVMNSNVSVSILHISDFVNIITFQLYWLVYPDGLENFGPWPPGDQFSFRSDQNHWPGRAKMSFHHTQHLNQGYFQHRWLSPALLLSYYQTNSCRGVEAVLPNFIFTLVPYTEHFCPNDLTS